jgi:hypothetical protein
MIDKRSNTYEYSNHSVYAKNMQVNMGIDNDVIYGDYQISFSLGVGFS